MELDNFQAVDRAGPSSVENGSGWGEGGEGVMTWRAGESAPAGQKCNVLVFYESKRLLRLYHRVNSAMNTKPRTVHANVNLLNCTLQVYVC